jgi:hypothetical protein
MNISLKERGMWDVHGNDGRHQFNTLLLDSPSFDIGLSFSSFHC